MVSPSTESLHTGLTDEFQARLQISKEAEEAPTANEVMEATSRALQRPVRSLKPKPAALQSPVRSLKP